MDIFLNIKKALDNQLPFVVYCKPNSSILKGWFQKNDTLFTSDKYDESGFIFAPFNDKHDAILLPENQSFFFEENITTTLDYIKKNQIKPNNSSEEKHIELSYIQKAKEDKKQFGFLYEKYFHQLFIFIFKKVQNEDLAGDICSKTFMKAMLNIGKYEDRGFPFSSWLYRIASNEVNLYFRAQKKEITIQINENQVTEIAQEIDLDNNEEQLHLILSKLQELPLEKSQLIEMRFFEGLSFKEIGSIFAISEATAKMRIYRIIESIKISLTKGST